MALAQKEKERIFDLLDNMPDAQRAIVLATFETFVSWLKGEGFYQEENVLQSLWARIKSKF
ncbi:hypothetical protein U14_01849 [Candidatus Moduliflexus flocculans]|uniref:Uncharacterized protein n=1 Tax=Candidatus Moduliflexus flocculans TaxID=1499966 RepID=A0A0S6VSY5_9BACT|nr:hypothetical protein U14_01849 [Candidatus Moduliflexus flocculans]